MTRATVNILGPVCPRLDGVDVAPRGAKLRTILAILALRCGTEVRSDELIEEIGLAGTSRTAVNALHAHIVRLRRWLGEHGAPADLVHTTNSGYRLTLPRDAVDAHRFVDLVERALDLAPTGAPSVVVAILEDALSLWRGDALADVIDGQMVATAADTLGQWRTVAWETLLDAWIVLERYNRVIPAARTLVAESPLNESIRIRHITALRRTGRAAEAVEVYRDASRTLAEELGVGPSPALRAAINGDGSTVDVATSRESYPYVTARR